MSFALELIAATREANLENLRELLSKKDHRGRYNVTDHDIRRALYEAASVGGSVEACRLLWERLSHFEKQMYGSIYMSRCGSPLHHAVRRGQLELVRLFIEEFQWNIDQANLGHETPLLLATNSEALTRYLLENGANVDTGLPYGPLYKAVWANRTEVARLLLVEYEADPNLYRRPVHEEEDYLNRERDLRITDVAIQKGNA
jgi:ankyrin repeat protein